LVSGRREIFAACTNGSVVQSVPISSNLVPIWFQSGSSRVPIRGSISSNQEPILRSRVTTPAL
jgi:hypothetical protein